MLICPVCGEKLMFSDKTMRCGSGHSFDVAKEGYVMQEHVNKQQLDKGKKKHFRSPFHFLISLFSWTPRDRLVNGPGALLVLGGFICVRFYLPGRIPNV